jgi:peptide/nickel transport system substrate-binding protein
MRRVRLSGLLLGLLAVFALVAAGCGGSDDQGSSGSKESNTTPQQGKQGGKLTYLAAADVDYIDPGQTYYTFGYQVLYATNRSLYAFAPEDKQKPRADLADGDPQISSDKKQITVKIKTGIKYAPPVNREVKSADIKYAFERAFSANVPSGYATSYFGDIVGAPSEPTKGVKPISGITTPDDQTIVFKLKRPVAVATAAALVMPISVPVPKEYAEKYDKSSPTDYDQFAAFTGPYMVKNDASGKLTGRDPGKRIELVRNPNWDASTDVRPAHLDEIVVEEGNADATVATRKIVDGSHLINGSDLAPTPSVLRDVVRKHKTQVQIIPAGGAHNMSLNTTIKPFDDLNVRKAVLAGFDRGAMLLTRGGTVAGDMPTHFLPPNIPGFDEAGGMKGPGVDFLNTTGKPNPQLSAEYFRKAGYADGKYDGGPQLLMVGVSSGIARDAAEVAKEQLTNMGFDLRLRLVSPDAMLTKFCRVPKAEVAVCPNNSWYKDFADAQTLLDPTFNGANILPTGNSNTSQLDVPAINAAMRQAETVIDPAGRAKAWARIDQMITEQAPAVPWSWDKTALIRSKDVGGVVTLMNDGWDLSYTSVR